MLLYFCITLQAKLVYLACFAAMGGSATTARESRTAARHFCTSIQLHHFYYRHVSLFLQIFCQNLHRFSYDIIT